MKKNKFVILILMVTINFTGCLTNQPNLAKTVSPPAGTNQDSLQDRQRLVDIYRPAIPEEGSLWSESSNNFFVDMRARKIGDLITVRISESPKAQLHAKTDTKRDSSITSSADFLGYMKALQAKNPNLDRTNLIDTSFKPTFTGEGTNNRDGSMTAYITATVVRVFPNGNLFISGTREITVNNETQFINITGIARPEDIDLNNEVQSTYLGDAKITYSGKGVIADKQVPGWMMRTLDNVWPF